MNCACTGGGHDPACPYFGTVVGVDGASAPGQGCAPGPGNAAVRGIACSTGVKIQRVVDRAYRLVSRLGFQPYRVFLVWELRSPDQSYRDLRRVELMPVEVADLKGRKIEVTRTGIVNPGEVRIQRVSPNQVTQEELLGYIDGQPWNVPGGRFFYEVVLHERCNPGAPGNTRWRFGPASMPHLSTMNDPLGFSIDLTDQLEQRDSAGNDRSVEVGEPDRRDSYLDAIRT